MKRIAIITLAAVALSGCSPEAKPKQGEAASGDVTNIRVVEIKRGDGAIVECAIYSSFNQGGLSCDWANAR